MKKYLWSVLFLSALRVSAQDVTFSCSYEGSGAVLTAHGFETDDLENQSSAISNLVDRILKLHHLPAKIQVQVSPQVNNAAAAARNGKPYILYSKYFVEATQSKYNGDWKIMGIFAHEIGHHLLFHTMAEASSRPDLELEADTWAGSTLYQLGATLEQALSCFESVSMKGSKTHPARDLRKQAMQKGWYEAKAANPAPVPVPKPRLEPAPTPSKPAVPVNMSFIAAPTLAYKMGNLFDAAEGSSGETAHSIELKPFVMDKYETTFEDYDRFCDVTGKTKPEDSGWGRGKRPVMNVSWFDACEYANWRSTQAGKTPCYTISGENVTCNWSANGFRLPTEAEWEYAASWNPNTNKKTRFGNGKDIADPAEMNFDGSESYKKSFSKAGEYRVKTVPVGSFSPNGQGLYDMAGNVWEWCWDWYDSYSNATANPKGADKGSGRVFRGGGWDGNPGYCRASIRYYGTPTGRLDFLGFRLLCSLQ